MSRLSGMRKFMNTLVKNGELIIVDEPVSHELEITEIIDRISKTSNGGKAVLFTQTGTDFPVLMNLLGSEKRIHLAFGGKAPHELGEEVLTLFQKMTEPATGFGAKLSKLPDMARMARWMPKKRKGKGICQEMIDLHPDLRKLPVLKCWPADGGPFITLPLVHTIDPITRIRNLGMYRMQIFSPNTTGMHWHMHKTGARHYREYKKSGERMPVAVALGGDPIYTYAATAPLPDGIDEYLLAGFIRKKAVKLVKCVTQNIWVPEDADIVIEGFVDPAEDLVMEGPFGDHTGFYSLADRYPVFHVTALTHKKDAVYPATIVGIPPQEDAWIAQATEELFQEPLRLTMIPELTDFHLPIAGVAHNIGLFTIRNDYPGMGRKILNSVWGAGQMMFTKFGIVFNESSNLRNYSELCREICQRVTPTKDIIISSGPLDILDHASPMQGFGGKMGMDATGEKTSMIWPSADDLLEASQQFRSCHPDVLMVNTELVNQEISVGLVIFQKSRPNQARQIADEIFRDPVFQLVHFWVLTDIFLSDLSWFEVAWIVGSNVEPSRDAWIFHVSEDPQSAGSLFLDASRKSLEFDGFSRDWPNPVVMSQSIINRVNDQWPKYALGPLIESPSERYAQIMKGAGAVSDYS